MIAAGYKSYIYIMNIHKLQIEGFKSISKIELTDLNPFTVFVGPNGAGKSNIFEALEFLQLCNTMDAPAAVKLFGNLGDIISQTRSAIRTENIEFYVDLKSITPKLNIGIDSVADTPKIKWVESKNWALQNYQNHKPTQLPPNDTLLNNAAYKQFSNFTRLFVQRPSIVKQNFQDDSRLIADASNLEKVLKRILGNEQHKEEIIEILQLLIPGFENVEIRSEELSGTDHLLIYESAMGKPISKRIISDGTYNILALIAAIYQSDEPQFLCIEEPENGLNPKVVVELVRLMREKCEAQGHFIWLNTHSQTLVAQLTADEIVLVDKVNGNTETKQLKGMNLYGLRMDEALLTNALGGGIPW